MPANANLALLKAAYAEWEASGGKPDPWVAITHEDFKLRSVAQGRAALSFAAPCASRNEFLDYLRMLTSEWRMDFWTAEHFVCEGDHISMIGRCGWTNRANGKGAEVLISHFWTFRDGKGASVIEVFDSAAIADAALP